MTPKKNNKDYDSTTPEPFKPKKQDPAPLENPDKTKKKEKNDPTRHSDPDITSQPGNTKHDSETPVNDSEYHEPESSIMNRTDV